MALKIGEWRFGMDVEGSHDVSVSPFYMAAHEVTFAEYAEFIKDNCGMTYIFGLSLLRGMMPPGTATGFLAGRGWRRCTSPTTRKAVVTSSIFPGTAKGCRRRSDGNGRHAAESTAKTQPMRDPMTRHRWPGSSCPTPRGLTRSGRRSLTSWAFTA